MQHTHFPKSPVARKSVTKQHKCVFACSFFKHSRSEELRSCFIFSIALFIWITENQAPCLKLLETMESQMFLFVLSTLRPSVRHSQIAQFFAWGWVKVAIYICHGTVPEVIASLKWVCQKLTDRCGSIVFCKRREVSHDPCPSLLLSQECLKRQLVLQRGDSAVETLM